MAEGGDDAPAPAQPPCLDSLASSWTRTALALCLASFATTLAVVGLTGAAYWNLERTQAFGAARSHTLGRRGPAPKVDYAYLPITSQPNTTGEVRQTDDGRTLAHLPRANSSEVSSSSLLRLPDESLLLAWFCSKEGDKDMAIVVSKLRAGARTWDYPYEVSCEAGMTARNPVLWYDEDAKHVVLYHTSEISGTGQATAEVRMLTSPDYGDSSARATPRFLITGAPTAKRATRRGTSATRCATRARRSRCASSSSSGKDLRRRRCAG